MINNFQNILKALRIDNSLSQQKLAEQIGVTQKDTDICFPCGITTICEF